MFLPLLEAPGPCDGRPLVIAVRGSRVLLHEALPDEPGLFLGTLAGRHCWAADLDGAEVAEDAFLDLFSLYGSVDETTWTVAGRAVQLIEWARTHRYCGRCGEATVDAPGERARRCPACGLLAFPRLAPAVIMLVEREDGRALLARNANFPGGMFSCLAGFVEPGETLEAAVQREIHEEIGIEVGDVAYQSSQPWPFPHSLMIGFTARYVSGDIVCDGTEIAEADWFAPDHLPNIPPPMSIARRLIDGWVRRAGF